MAIFDVIDEIAEKQVLKTETGDNRIFGIVVGQVAKNYDKDRPGRICVSIYTRDKEANELKWARVAMPSSGSKWGHYFLPEVGDHVLVAFEQGNIEKPYVIGCIPKETDQFLKKTADEDNRYKKIMTRHGSTIRFEDDKEGDGEKDKICIETPKTTHRIELDNEKGLMLLSDKDGKNKIEIQTGEKGAIEIFAEKKLTIRVGENITLTMNGSNGTTQLETTKLDVKVNGSMKYASTGAASLEGSSVGLKSTSAMNLESSASVKISGTPISIG